MPHAGRLVATHNGPAPESASRWALSVRDWHVHVIAADPVSPWLWHSALTVCGSRHPLACRVTVLSGPQAPPLCERCFAAGRAER